MSDKIHQNWVTSSVPVWEEIKPPKVSEFERLKKRVKELKDGMLAEDVIDKQAAEIDALRKRVQELEADAKRGRYMIDSGCWHISEDQTHLAVLVPQGSDLSCYAMRVAAVDAAMKLRGGNGEAGQVTATAPSEDSYSEPPHPDVEGHPI